VSVPLFHDEKIKIKENLVPRSGPDGNPPSCKGPVHVHISREKQVLACKCVSLASESAAPGDL